MDAELTQISEISEPLGKQKEFLRGANSSSSRGKALLEHHQDHRANQLLQNRLLQKNSETSQSHPPSPSEGVPVCTPPPCFPPRQLASCAWLSNLRPLPDQSILPTTVCVRHAAWLAPTIQQTCHNTISPLQLVSSFFLP